MARPVTIVAPTRGSSRPRVPSQVWPAVTLRPITAWLMTNATNPVSRMADPDVPSDGTSEPSVPATGKMSWVDSMSSDSCEATHAPSAVVGTRKISVVTKASPMVAATLPRIALITAP